MNTSFRFLARLQVLGWVVTAALPTASSAQSFILQDHSGLNLVIPDGDPFGVSVTSDVSLPAGTFEVLGIEVSLDVSGGFNGDLYASLTHGSGFSVLLNRPGRDAGNELGYDDAGYQITLADGGTQGDVHEYQNVTGPLLVGSRLTGTWEPDGRAVDPSQVVTGDPRTATFASFVGADPSGTWTLFLLDSEAGDEARLDSWSLRVSYAAVPEPAEISAYAALGLLGFGILCRCRNRPK